MADGADAAGGAVLPQFTARRIGGDGMAVGCRNGVEGTGDGPDIAGEARLVAAVAGIDIHHLLHLAVAVPVIQGVVDVGEEFRQSLGGLMEHVLAVVDRRRADARLHLGADLDGAIDIELQVEQAARLVAEVVCHAARPLPLVVVLLVEHRLIGRLGVISRKVAVGEGHQHYQLAVDTIRIPVGVGVRHVFLSPACQSGRLLPQLFRPQQMKHAEAVTRVGVSCHVLVAVEVAVTPEGQCQHGAVGLHVGVPLRQRSRGGGTHGEAACRQHEGRPRRLRRPARHPADDRSVVCHRFCRLFLAAKLLLFSVIMRCSCFFFIFPFVSPFSALYI